MATPAQNYQALVGANDVVAQAIEKLLLDALRHDATFIHLEPVGTATSPSPVRVEARLKVMGELTAHAKWSATMGKQMVSRLHRVAGIGALTQGGVAHGHCDVAVPTQAGTIQKRLDMTLMETTSGPALSIKVVRLA